MDTLKKLSNLSWTIYVLSTRFEQGREGMEYKLGIVVTHIANSFTVIMNESFLILAPLILKSYFKLILKE